MKYLLLVIIAFAIGCSLQPTLKECKIACKGNLKEFTDDIISCSCFDHGGRK